MPTVTRRWWLKTLLGAVAAMCAPAASSALMPRTDGDDLRIAAPELHFITGAPLERLHNGASISFAFQLSLTTQRNAPPVARTLERFVISYDLWEEKFSVARLGRFRRSTSHLSAGAAESWCLENLVLSTRGLPPTQPLWLRLEVRAEEPRDGLGVVDDPGINLTRLVEIFSRPARGQQPRWELEAGPLRLAELRKAELLRR
ncbi:MAG: hypothetical protein IT158_27165 [Bryobacterales bacterium]|nr:hypothetical protein [Bryobacterales bacterium]